MSTTINGSTTPALSHPNLFMALAAPGAYFLYNHAWTDVRTDNDFQASLTVAKMLLQVSNLDPHVFNKFVDYGVEVSRTTRTQLHQSDSNLLENWAGKHFSTRVEYPPPGCTARFFGRLDRFGFLPSHSFLLRSPLCLATLHYSPRSTGARSCNNRHQPCVYIDQSLVNCRPNEGIEGWVWL